MEKNVPLVLTGQQIGIGWSPALSVIKALVAIQEAKRIGGKPIFWMADEDHDAIEISRSAIRRQGKIIKIQFEFNQRPNTSIAWFPFLDSHQEQAVELWGSMCPNPELPTLRSHFETLGQPLKELGLSFFSPTRDVDRFKLNALLRDWRDLNLENKLKLRFDELEYQGIACSINPSTQATWFTLDPRNGRRTRLEQKELFESDLWLSPGAALRPLVQSHLLNVHTVILGPSEMSYWQLIDPLWEILGIRKPILKLRPSLWTIPAQSEVSVEQLPLLQNGNWEALLPADVSLPSKSLTISLNPQWDSDSLTIINQELKRTRNRLQKIDRRIQRLMLRQTLGEDPEVLQHHLFPLGKDQERILSGAPWLLNHPMLSQLTESLSKASPVVIMKEL